MPATAHEKQTVMPCGWSNPRPGLSARGPAQSVHDEPTPLAIHANSPTDAAREGHRTEQNRPTTTSSANKNSQSAAARRPKPNQQTCALLQTEQASSRRKLDRIRPERIRTRGWRKTQEI